MGNKKASSSTGGRGQILPRGTTTIRRAAHAGNLAQFASHDRMLVNRRALTEANREKQLPRAWTRLTAWLRAVIRYAQWRRLQHTHRSLLMLPHRGVPFIASHNSFKTITWPSLYCQIQQRALLPR
jgi:hypothetical protein